MLVYKLVIARVLIFLVIYCRLLRNVIVPPMLLGDSFSRWYVSLSLGKAASSHRFNSQLSQLPFCPCNWKVCIFSNTLLLLFSFSFI